MYLGMLLEMDKTFGSLIIKIEQEGLANNTLIIFSSDNGDLWKSNEGSIHCTSGLMKGAKSDI